MSRRFARVDRFLRQAVSACMLAGCVLAPFPPHARAQTPRQNGDPFFVPLPVQIDWGQSFSPLGQNKLTTDRYRVQAGTENLKFQYANQAPAFWGGRQFEAMPGGYQLTNVSLSRKWGTMYALRTVGYSSRIMVPESVRNLSGAGIELPHIDAGTNVAAYFLHASPSEQARSFYRDSLMGSAGSQAGITLGRKLWKAARFQAEWAQSQYSGSTSTAPLRDRRSGLWARIDATLAHTELGFTLLARQRGLANPAFPSIGAARRGGWLDVRRKWKGHQFQYSRLSDAQRSASAVQGVREDTVRWVFIHGRLPQLSASETRSRQTGYAKTELENTLRLGIDKSIRQVNFAFSLASGSRSDAKVEGVLWERRVLAGDASIAVTKEQRLHIRYEANEFRQNAPAQRVFSSVLRFDTRFDLLAARFSIAPALDLRRQEGSLPAFDITAARLTIAAQVKIPPKFPGTNLFLFFGTSHVQTAGGPLSSHAEFRVSWNFSRM